MQAVAQSQPRALLPALQQGPSYLTRRYVLPPTSVWSSDGKTYDDAIRELDAKKAELAAAKNLVRGMKAKPARSLDLCFLMDCTGSMASWIEAAKQEVVNIILKAHNMYQVQIRVSFVGYRDYGDRHQYVIQDFTQVAKEIQAILENVKAEVTPK